MTPARAAPPDPVDRRDIVSLFAPTLGWDKSEELVNGVRYKLCLPRGAMSAAQALTILDELALEPGIVGVTARFLRSRGDLLRNAPPTSERTGVRPVEDPADVSPPSSKVSPRRDPPREEARLDVRELTDLLAGTLGNEKAQEAIAAGAKRLALPEGRITHAQASLLFEDLARQPGLVGITARFAKARLMLKLGGRR